MTYFSKLTKSQKKIESLLNKEVDLIQDNCDCINKIWQIGKDYKKPKNKYSDVYISDLIDLNEFYYKITGEDKKSYKKALEMWENLETAIRELVPVKLIELLQKEIL